MKRLFCLLLLLALAAEAVAQADALYLSSRRQPVRISLGAGFQHYEQDSLDVEEVSVPLVVSAPLGRRFGVSLVAHQASASGAGLADVSGLSDAQLGLSYYARLGRSSLVASLGLNLPSGQRELSTPEFETTVLLSQHFFNFRVPGFGQGFNVAPGLVVAVPVSEDVVVGAGASYQVKGAYAPLDSLDDYDPGDELTLTGGLDLRAGPAANVSAEVSYTYYAADTIDGAEAFTAGSKITATAQFRQLFGRNELRLVGRYRSAARSALPATFDAPAQDLRTIPTQFLLQAEYRPYLTPAFVLGLVARARLFGETDVFERQNAFDAGLAPAYALSETVALQARFVYTAGDVNGFDVGAGLTVEL